MLRAEWIPYRLRFTFTAVTSRETMQAKDTYIIKVWDVENPECVGIGECNLFRGLSADDTPVYESQIDQMCRSGLEEIPQCSSLLFGAETALADLRGGGQRLLWPSAWTRGEEGIRINGLVWMGSKQLMLSRIKEKVAAGFRCIKLKIGGINIEEEIELVEALRSHFPVSELEIRLDANGSLSPENALRILELLSQYGIHSIEQPIHAGQWREMEKLCSETPIPIALDEELIGMRSDAEKQEMLDAIKPQYIILKPALCGGFGHADAWIAEAEKRGIGWWATSALESDIGLNAIAQWVALKNPEMPQGLGTGQLYSNNFPSPLNLRGERLWHDPSSIWALFNII